jgi:hypothetical protein
MFLFFRYLDKGIEFMCLIASTHFHRYDKGTCAQFTTLLLNFTFAQTNPLLYYECLEIWKLILDHLLSEVPFVNFSSRDELLDNLKPVLLDLALGIVNSTKKFEIPDSEEYFDDEVCNDFNNFGVILFEIIYFYNRKMKMSKLTAYLRM